MLTVDKLKSRLSYDPDTGLFTWISKASGNSRVKIGQVAGTKDDKGYVVIKLEGKVYKAHRLAFLYMTGEWPDHFIDHRDLDPGNNRWANLREATNADNQANRLPSGQSGAKGVVWHKKDKKWQAQLTRDGKTIYLGQYDSMAQAAMVYRTAARDLHGEYARAS